MNERCYKSNGSILLCTLDRGHIGFHHYHIYDNPTKCMAMWSDNGMTLLGDLIYERTRKNAGGIRIEQTALSKTL